MKIDKQVWEAIRKYPDAYDEGMQAAIDGKDATACKYPNDLPQRWAWRAGFLGVC
jgi:ribosome modulation factor